MDPVSLAASIITLISATTVSINALTRLWNLRGRPEYLCPAINEVEDFKASLELVRATLESPSQGLDEDVQAEIERLISRAKAQIDAFHHFLKAVLKYQTSGDGRNPSFRFRAKFDEVVGKNERRITDVRREIGSIKGSLNLAIGVANQRTLPHLRMSIQSISFVSSGGSSTLRMITDTVQQTASVVEGITSTHLGEDQSTQLPSSGTVRGKTPRPDELVHGSASTSANTETASYLLLRMKPGQTPRWLRSLIGAAFFNSTGAPLLNHRSCNVTNCGAKYSGSGAMYFQYFFPTWLLSTGIQITGSWKNLSGPGATWNLRIPKVATERSILGDVLGIIQQGSVENLRRYLSEKKIGANAVMPDGYTIFEYAVSYSEDCKETLLIMLLEEGVSVDFQTDTNGTVSQYLCRAAITDPASFTTISDSSLFEDGLEMMNFTALHKISAGLSQENLDAQIRLDRRLVNATDCFGRTPLHWAIVKGSTDAIGLLLDAGSDVNAQSKDGRSALHYAAAYQGSTQLFERLLSMGADATLTDCDGENVLFTVSEYPDPDPALVPLLIRHGIDINSRIPHDQRYTCLMFACQYSSADFCRSLIENGADIEMIDADGLSAIFYGVMGNNPEVVRLFIERGAVLNRVNTSGFTLLDDVVGSGGVEIMDLLQAARIEGLNIKPEDIERYWLTFEGDRPIRFVGEREPVEVERQAFQALLDSIVPHDSTQSQDKHDHLDIPGAFPVEDDVVRNYVWSSYTEKEDVKEARQGLKVQSGAEIPRGKSNFRTCRRSLPRKGDAKEPDELDHRKDQLRD